MSEDEDDDEEEEEEEVYENYEMDQPTTSCVNKIYAPTPACVTQCSGNSTVTTATANTTTTSTRITGKRSHRRCSSADWSFGRSITSAVNRRRCASEASASSPDIVPPSTVEPLNPPRKVISKTAPVWRSHFYSFKHPTAVTSRKRNLSSRIDLESEFDETFDDEEDEEDGVYWAEREEEVEEEEYYHVPTMYSRASKKLRSEQHHQQRICSIKLDNKRLRRQVESLLQQRDELQASNQLLVKQNMRLRKSNRRAVAVVRAAEQSVAFGHFRPQQLLHGGKLKTKVMCPNNSNSRRGSLLVGSEPQFLSATSSASSTNGRRLVNGRLALSNCSRIPNISADPST